MGKNRLFFLLIICIVFLLAILAPSHIYATEAKTSKFMPHLLIINKAVNELAYFKDGKLEKVFPVGTGKSRKLTPEGTFTIANKIKNRPYYKEKIPGGSPRNPLGDRWMGLDVPGTWGQTYGIHGTNNEKSIGKYSSAGCIRMHNADVRWLFEQVPVGTTVHITYADKDFLTIAQENGFKVKLPKVEKVDKKVTLFAEKTLYKKAVDYKSYIVGKIAPQTVTAFEETDHGWYRIYTWFGDAWISKSNTIEGQLEKKEKKITLSSNTLLYSSPTITAVSIGALSPQTVTSFERIGNWHHIYTWFGDAWIYVNEKVSDSPMATAENASKMRCQGFSKFFCIENGQQNKIYSYKSRKHHLFSNDALH
ncbi:L,D-transpeptidase [Calidifontibacillus erzurumensis]|uniref:L,D-transpeptidase n=1 Tax=Calidifontibacillus erzurumensis TaxID=2741433 RepID=A0A8J8GE07_9BACI|nr:L,D-transpeptidase [Calidifontibacillus erzurumensis]NSL52129.1 L,D-transpeptidase [Calidifontibacillus erzurumensis]